MRLGAIVFLLAAAVLAWWLLAVPMNGDRSGPEKRAPRMADDPAHRPARLLGSDGLPDPELPREPGPAPLTDPAAGPRNTVKYGIVSEVNWNGIPLSEAISFLRDRFGVNFILRVSGEMPVTIHRSRVPLSELLQAIGELTGTKYQIQGPSIVLLPGDASLSMTTKTFRLPEAQAAGMANSQQARQMLTDAGIRLPDGAFAAVEAQSGRLIVKTIPEEFARIENYLESGNPDAPFVWSPELIGKREYVSADKVRRFYAFQHVTNPTQGQDTLIFWSEGLGMMWRRNDTAIRVGSAEIPLKHPVIEHEGEWWISRADLSRVLEPALRPPPQPPQ